MKFANFESRLVLTHNPAANTQKVAIVTSVSEAIKRWQSLTRISPIFGVEGAQVKSPATYTFPGEKQIIFLGPVRPDLAIQQCSKRSTVWLTLGLFNVVIVAADPEEGEKLREWATDADIPWERWRTANGTIESVDSGGHRREHQSVEWRDSLAALSDGTYGEELQDAVHEYCTLMASSIARSITSAKVLTPDLLRLAEAVEAIVLKVGASQGDGRYVALGQMLTVNAGLSRFSSQTFAGTSAIRQTECHYWTHSLMGVGIATLALRNLIRFIERTLGEAQLPVRFGLLRTKTKDVPNLSTTDMPNDDPLGRVELAARAAPKLIPLLPYFSARDGYRSTELSISAPLSVICSCRSRSWSLTTLTHEISHVVIRAILGDLIPDLHNDAQLDECFQLLERGTVGPSVFDEIRRQTLFSIGMMEKTHSGRTGDMLITRPILQHMIQRWRHEVDEIMVHVFDYMYFYGRNTELYVAGIWASWGTIPNVRSRVKEYVTRTVCAVLALHHRRGGNAEDLARVQVQSALTRLVGSGQGGRYVNEAISYLSDDWATIRPRVAARRGLVKIVASYLFSETIATAVRTESEVTGGTGDREGYSLKVRELDAKAISNPLRFTEIYTEANEANSIDSAWMLYVLAFGVQPDAN